MRPIAIPVFFLLTTSLIACNPDEDVSRLDASDIEAAGSTAAELAATTEISELSKVPSGSYTIDKKHAYISFSYLHKGLSRPVVGFRSFDVEMELDTRAPQNSMIKVVIDAASIDSRVSEFDEHLRDDKLFDVANYPNITFTSTNIRLTGVNGMEVTGDLTMKGVTRPVTLDTSINKAMIDPRKNLAIIGVSATTTIKRSDWNLGYAVPVVGDAVTINIELEMPQVPSED
ncbi:MAG: YceI family protein [Gammaproteobacteria bacterium]|nr:YceI family protein [Gammaproteobacteria bacterium]